jgi:alpha-ketoglutarate-dependent taurine dioxygenase
MLFYSLVPLGPALAAEVVGIDLSAPLDPDTAAALGEALAAHRVLLFRGQLLTREQHRRAAEALQLPAATMLYGAAAPAATNDTAIADLRGVREELPEAEQVDLAGLPAAELRDYLHGRVEWIEEQVFVYRHDWREGDVLLIDDRATVQRATAEEAGQSLWRIVVEAGRITG